MLIDRKDIDPKVQHLFCFLLVLGQRVHKRPERHNPRMRDKMIRFADYTRTVVLALHVAEHARKAVHVRWCVRFDDVLNDVECLL